MIVSLTTTGRRIGRIIPTLESVRKGRLQPDRLILWLNREGSPVAPGVDPQSIPSGVSNLCEVRWCENWGPATKLLPAMQAFPDESIATLDDDVLYPDWWLERLAAAHAEWPDRILCYRARRIEWNGAGVLPYNKWQLVKWHTAPDPRLITTGVHGVLFPPNSLRPEAFDLPLLQRYSLPNDDLWFSVMRKKSPMVIQRGSRFQSRNIRGPRLSKRNCRGRNDTIIRSLADRFGPWTPWYGGGENGH